MLLIRSIFSNLTTLLVAFLLAVVIWATAVRAGDPLTSRTLEVPVEVTGLPVDADLVTRPPESVLITIQGPNSALETIVPSDFAAVIDVSDVAYGEATVPIEIKMIGSQEQIEIVSRFPESATIRLEQIVTREIPITLQIRGEVARGHRIDDARVEPNSALITGPAPRVDQLAEGRVVIFVDEARENISELRRPNYYDMDGNIASVVGLDIEPNEIEIIIPVEELAGFAEKPITVNWIGEPAPGHRLLDVKVEPSSVQVTGAPATLDGLRVQTEAIDISGLDETTVQQVALDLPDGVRLVDIQPIVVTVEIEPILSSGVVQRPVEVRALGDGLEATLDPEEVRVFLFGPLPVLDSLADDDVRVTVDLLNLITGTHVLEPFVSLSTDEVEVRSTQPALITVIISGVVTTTEELEPASTVLGLDLISQLLETTAAQDSEAIAGGMDTLVALLPEGGHAYYRRNAH